MPFADVGPLKVPEELTDATLIAIDKEPYRLAESIVECGFSTSSDVSRTSWTFGSCRTTGRSSLASGSRHTADPAACWVRPPPLPARATG